MGICVGCGAIVDWKAEVHAERDALAGIDRCRRFEGEEELKEDEEFGESLGENECNSVGRREDLRVLLGMRGSLLV